MDSYECEFCKNGKFKNDSDYDQNLFDRTDICEHCGGTGIIPVILTSNKTELANL